MPGLLGGIGMEGIRVPGTADPWRQVLGLYEPLAAQDESVLDDISQFADIPRPVIVHEDIEGLPGEPSNGSSTAGSDLRPFGSPCFQ